MPRLRSYEDTIALDAGALRALLRDGDDQERLWAAWALALAAGTRAGAVLHDRTGSEPSPGVRRHLIVVLAGLGEHGAVRTFAASDPDPYVRATAYRYALKAPGHERTDQARVIAAAAVADPSDVVREECVRLLDHRWPIERRRDLLTLLGDAAPGVRSAAVERLREDGASRDELAALAQRLAVEPDPDLRALVVGALVDGGGLEALARCLPAASLDVVHETLDRLAQRSIHLSWSPLAALAARRIPALDLRILPLLASPGEADLTWLAACAVRALSWPKATNRAEWAVANDVERAGNSAREILFQRLAVAEPARVSDEDRHLLRVLLEWLRGEEQRVFTDADSWDEDDYQYADEARDWGAQLAEQRRALEFFLERSLLH